MKRRDTPTLLQQTFQQTGYNGFLSEGEDYDLAPDPYVLHTRTNNFYNEKIILGNFFSSMAKLDNDNDDEEGQKHDSSRILKEHMNVVHESFRKHKINQMFEDFQIIRFWRSQNKIRCHSLETLSDRSYYESSKFTNLIKRVKSKVLY